VGTGPLWITKGMFTDHAIGLDLDYPVARARFLRLTHGGWLDDLSQDAYTDGLVGEVRVGPFGSVPGMSKLVQVSLLDPVPQDDMVLVPIRWEATGRMGRLFPVLDANLIVCIDGQGRAVLRITGSYRPPLNGLGDGLDRAVLYRVAGATLKSLLRRIAAVLAQPAAGAAGQDVPDRGAAAPDVPPEMP
jgi:hypothetical protein